MGLENLRKALPSNVGNTRQTTSTGLPLTLPGASGNTSLAELDSKRRKTLLDYAAVPSDAESRRYLSKMTEIENSELEQRGESYRYEVQDGQPQKVDLPRTPKFTGPNPWAGVGNTIKGAINTVKDWVDGEPAPNPNPPRIQQVPTQPPAKPVPVQEEFTPPAQKPQRVLPGLMESYTGSRPMSSPPPLYEWTRRNLNKPVPDSTTTMRAIQDENEANAEIKSPYRYKLDRGQLILYNENVYSPDATLAPNTRPPSYALSPVAAAERAIRSGLETIGEVELGVARGVGKSIEGVGRGVEWATNGTVGAGMKDFGKAIADNTKPDWVNEEDIPTFAQKGWKALGSLGWWTNTAPEYVGQALPYMIPGLGVGSAVTRGAAALGASAQAASTLGVFSAAFASNMVESVSEAGEAYDQAITAGKQPDEAAAAARTTFKGNVAKLPVDSVEYWLALAPVPVQVKGILKPVARALRTAPGRVAKYGIGQAAEGAEEVYQENLKRYAIDGWQAVDLTDATSQEAFLGGLIGGLGLTAAGAVREITNPDPHIFLKKAMKEAGLNPSMDVIESVVADIQAGTITAEPMAIYTETLKRSIAEQQAQTAEPSSPEPQTIQEPTPVPKESTDIPAGPIAATDRAQLLRDANPGMDERAIMDMVKTTAELSDDEFRAFTERAGKPEPPTDTAGPQTGATVAPQNTLAEEMVFYRGQMVPTPEETKVGSRRNISKVRNLNNVLFGDNASDEIAQKLRKKADYALAKVQPMRAAKDKIDAAEKPVKKWYDRYYAINYDERPAIPPEIVEADRRYKELYAKHDWSYEKTRQLEDLERLAKDQDQLASKYEREAEDKRRLAQIADENSDLLYLTSQRETAEAYANQRENIKKRVPNPDILIGATPEGYEPVVYEMRGRFGKTLDLTKLGQGGIIDANDALKTLADLGVERNLAEQMVSRISSEFDKLQAFSLFRGDNLPVLRKALTAQGYDSVRYTEGEQDNWIVLDRSKVRQTGAFPLTKKEAFTTPPVTAKPAETDQGKPTTSTPAITLPEGYERVTQGQKRTFTPTEANAVAELLDSQGRKAVVVVNPQNKNSRHVYAEPAKTETAAEKTTAPVKAEPVKAASTKQEAQGPGKSAAPATPTTLAPLAEGTPKELWQQTRAEAVGEAPVVPDSPRPLKAMKTRPDAKEAQQKHNQQVAARQKALREYKAYVERSNAHMRAVEQALLQRKPVPPEVVTEYPSFVEKYGNRQPDQRTQPDAATEVPAQKDATTEERPSSVQDRLRGKVDTVEGKGLAEQGGASNLFTGSAAPASTASADVPAADPATEARYQAAGKGLPLASQLELFKDSVRTGWNKMTREFEHLARIAKYAELRSYLHKFLKGEGIASDKAVRYLQGITVELSRKTGEYNLFRRFVVYADMMEDLGRIEGDIDPNMKLAYGFTPATLRAEYARVSKAAEANEKVKRAIADRKDVQKEIADRYIAAYTAVNGKKPPINRASYFHHEVIAYMGAGKSTQGVGTSTTKLRAPNGRGWLKVREGSSQDFSNAYLEVEHKVMSQMLFDTTKYEFQVWLSKSDLNTMADVLAAAQAAGEENWRKLVPEGQTIWSPKSGSQWVKDSSVPVQVADDIMQAGLNEAGLDQATMDKIMYGIGKRIEMVLPTEVAMTLDQIGRLQEKATMFQRITGMWKRHVLLFPTRVLKYNVRNVSGDLDAVIAGNPSTLRQVPKAVSELYQYLINGGAASANLEAWMNEGGIQDVFNVADKVSSISALKQFQNISDQSGIKKALYALWKAPEAGSNFREYILRYATYLSYKDQMIKTGGRPLNYGASIREEINALKSIDTKAYKLSNDLLGAYDEVTVFGQWLRQGPQPFWSFTETNYRRYYRLLRNAFEDGNLTATAGRTVATKLGRVALKSPVIAYRLGKFALRVSALSALLAAWNYLRYPDEEEDLPADVRARPHIIFGRDDKGDVKYFSRLGSVGEFLDWFGFDEDQQRIKAYLNGEMTWQEVAKDIAMRKVMQPVNKLAQGTGLAKTIAETALGVTRYPDITKSRAIRDQAGFAADSLGLGDVYRLAKGRPTKGIGSIASNLVTYTASPLETAYFDATALKYDWKNKHAGGTGNPNYNDKANALYYLKLAIRYADADAMEKYMQEYVDLKGTKASMKESINEMNPMSGNLTKAQEKEFKATLTPEQLALFAKAEQYWQEVIKNEDYKNLPAYKSMKAK